MLESKTENEWRWEHVLAILERHLDHVHYLSLILPLRFVRQLVALGWLQDFPVALRELKL